MANYDQVRNKYDSLLQNGYDFDIGQVIEKGWNLFQRDWANILGFILMLIGIVLLGIIIPILGWIALLIFMPVLAASPYILMDKIAKKEAYTYKDILIETNESLGSLWGSFILMGILCMIGYVCFIIPGIYLALAYEITVPIIIFGKLDAFAGMEISRKIITQRWWKFLLLVFILGLLSSFASIIPVVGIFVSMCLRVSFQYAAYAEIVGVDYDNLEQKINDIGVHPKDAWN